MWFPCPLLASVNGDGGTVSVLLGISTPETSTCLTQEGFCRMDDGKRTDTLLRSYTRWVASQ